MLIAHGELVLLEQLEVIISSQLDQFFAEFSESEEREESKTYFSRKKRKIEEIDKNGDSNDLDTLHESWTLLQSVLLHDKRYVDKQGNFFSAPPESEIKDGCTFDIGGALMNIMSFDKWAMLIHILQHQLIPVSVDSPLSLLARSLPNIRVGTQTYETATAKLQPFLHAASRRFVRKEGCKMDLPHAALCAVSSAALGGGEGKEISSNGSTTSSPFKVHINFFQ